MKKRLDHHLVDSGLAPSKTKAQEMIMSNQVELVTCVDGQERVTVACKPAQRILPEKIEVRLKKNNLLKYVSRAGFKLEGALDHLRLDVSGMKALDVGQSTGGFTDCLLQRGALHVTGVDVAENELAQSLVSDPRVTFLPKINARELSKEKRLHHQTFDLVVMDVSFISLGHILPEVTEYMKPSGRLLCLVKPQFEVGGVNISKKGIVKSAEAVAEVEKKLRSMALSLELVGIQYFPAKIKGRDGNQEFFLYGEKN